MNNNDTSYMIIIKSKKNMIETVSDFLEEFKQYALKKIKEDNSDITHRPTIGNIFEGLTSELLNYALFQNLNIRIVEKSFIYNDSGQISFEMDCLLVVGEGIKISHTNQFKYHIKDVIAVIQVKKKLYANDIDDSFDNLKSVIKISEPRQAEKFVGRLHRDAYRILTSKDLPIDENIENNLIYHILLMEAFYPLRIVIGYYGYSDEYALREGFVKKLKEKCTDGPVKGYGPSSIPNIIICGNNTIIKNNGMPIGASFNNSEYYWPLLLTSNERPMYYLLELIWSRLSYKFNGTSKIFGDDLQLDSMHPFISCKERIIDSQNRGWEYNYIELCRKELAEKLERIEWKPVELTTAQYVILNKINNNGFIDLFNDNNLVDFLNDENEELNSFVDKLVKTKLVYVNEGKMYLLTDQLEIIIWRDGNIYAGENKSGQMTNYFLKNN